MKIFKAFKHEIKNTMATTYKRVALLAVILVPLLYGALYLNAFWDPYSSLDKVSVAVVNLDKGYDNNGTAENVGKDLTSMLKNDDNLNWQFMNAKDASTCLAKKKCYASLTVPADFSADIYSVNGKNPQATNLIYRSREATNYLATTLTNSVSEKVTDALSHKLIAKYLNNIFVSLRNTSSDLNTAANVSFQLSSGLKTVSNGLTDLQNGLSNADTGGDQLVSGLNNLNVNQNKLTAGLNSSLAGVGQLKTGADTISGGLGKIEASVAASQDKTSDAIGQVTAYVSGSGTNANLIAALNDLYTVYCTNDGLVATDSTSVIPNVATYCTNAPGAISKLKSGSASLSAGLSSLSAGLTTAKEGSVSLANGNQQLTNGATTLNNGIATLSSGASSLSSGVNKINNGSTELSTNLETGAKTMADNTGESKVAAETTVMAAPVTMTKNSYDLVANYGSSFAPYFISLALWVGALLAFFVIDFSKEPNSRGKVIIKYMVLALVGIVQAVILDLVLQNILGLSVANPIQFYAITILVSLAFMALLQLCIQQLGDIGRYVAVILLILQLASAAGTFPLETIPKFFQIINPFMPMTYSVMALRDILFTHELLNIWGPVACFVSMIIISSAINLLLTRRRTKLTKHVVL